MSQVISLDVQGGVMNKAVEQAAGAGAGMSPLSSASSAPSAPEDAVRFRDALERHAEARAAGPAGGDSASLGSKIATRTSTLASEVQKDQQYVSKLLETATRTGDSMHLMKAMMALSDYQIKVQTISKTVSKATSALEQLTKLQ